MILIFYIRNLTLQATNCCPCIAARQPLPMCWRPLFVSQLIPTIEHLFWTPLIAAPLCCCSPLDACYHVPLLPHHNHPMFALHVSWFLLSATNTHFSTPNTLLLANCWLFVHSHCVSLDFYLPLSFHFEPLWQPLPFNAAHLSYILPRDGSPPFILFVYLLS